MVTVSATVIVNQYSNNRNRIWILGLISIVCLILVFQETPDPCLLAVEPSYNSISEQYVYQNIVVPRTSLWRRSHDNALVFCVCEFHPCLPVCCPHPNSQNLYGASCQNHINSFSENFNNMLAPETIYVPQNMTYKTIMRFDEDKIQISSNGVLSYYNHKTKIYKHIDPFHYCVAANVIKNAIDGAVSFTYNIYQRFELVEITNFDIANMVCKYLKKYNL